MQIVIDISEKLYRQVKDPCIECGYIATECYNAIYRGTPIPDNATNGDIVQMMFPNVNVYEHNGGATYSVNNEYNFNATWWNAPYQKGESE